MISHVHDALGKFVMSTQKSKSKSKSKSGSATRRLLAAALILLVLAGVGYGFYATRNNDNTLENTPVYTVENQDLVISLTESGNIVSRDLTKVKSEVRGSVSIIWLIEEGTQVDRGDLLVELDASEFKERLVDQEISLQNAEASYTQAYEQLEVTKNAAQASVSQAKLDYQFAQEDLIKYKEGEFPKQLKETEAKITLAREELEQAEEKLEWSQKLYDQKFISESEYETDVLAKKRKELDYELRQTELDLLEKFTYKRQLAQLESDVEQNKLALERAERKARADIVQAEADLRAKDAQLKRQREKLEELKEQVANCRIIAPSDGMVVYATTGGNRWRQAEPIQEGSAVRERQEIIHLPRSQSMMAEFQIHESSLKKVKVGQPARLTVDAIPGKVLNGVVGKIALLPSQTTWWNPDLVVYDGEIYIESNDASLRTGMKCTIEILVDQYENTLAVPIQSVQRVNGKPTVWLKEGENFVPQSIDVGLDNNRMVHVLGGLKPGDVISLTPPLDAATGDDLPMDQVAAGNDDSSKDSTSERYSKEGQWDDQTVTKAREINSQKEKPRPKLSEDDQKFVQIMLMAKQRGFLDRIDVEQDVRTQIDDMLSSYDAGTLEAVDSTLRSNVQAAMQKMRNRRRASDAENAG